MVLAVGKTVEEVVEGLHGVEVGGHVELGGVLDGDDSIKDVSQLEVIEDLHGAFEQFHVLLLFDLDLGVNQVSGIAAGAILLDAGNDIKGEGVLDEEVDSGGKGFFGIEEARLLRGERLRGIIHGRRAQIVRVDGVIGAKGGRNRRVKGDAEVVLQPGGDADSTVAGVRDEEAVVLHLARGVVDPLWTRGLATSVRLGRLHVVSDIGRGRGASPSGLGRSTSGEVRVGVVQTTSAAIGVEVVRV